MSIVSDPTSLSLPTSLRPCGRGLLWGCTRIRSGVSLLDREISPYQLATDSLVAEFAKAMVELRVSSEAVYFIKVVDPLDHFASSRFASQDRQLRLLPTVFAYCFDLIYCS